MNAGSREKQGDRAVLRWSRRFVGAVVAVMLLWLVGVNLLLNTPLAEWALNRNAETWTISWQRAWAPYPFEITLTGFVFERSSKNRDAVISADKIAAKIQIAALFDRTFRAEEIEASGVRVLIDRGQGLESHHPAADGPPGFKIQLLGIVVEELEEFRYDAFSLIGGSGSARGDFEVQIRGDVTLRNAHLDWLEARGRAREHGASETVDVKVRGEISSFDPRKEKGADMLSHLSGVVEVEGDVDSIGPLEYFFGGAKWIEDLDGVGAVDVHLAIENGQLQEESRIAVQAEDLVLDFMGFRATGSGWVDGKIEHHGDGRGANMTVLFEEFTYGRQTVDEPLAHGEGLRLAATIADLDSAKLVEEITVTLDMPVSAVPDVSFLGQTVPESLGLELTGGSATMQVFLEARGGRQHATGTFALQATELRGSFKDFEFEIDLDVSTKLSGRDWDDFEVRLKGTEIRFSNGVFTHPEIAMTDGWWMTVGIPIGRANVSEPLEIEAEVDLAMRDTRVLVAMFAELKAWIRHFDGMLTVEDIVGRARAFLADQHLVLQELSLTGNKLEAMGELDLERGDANAILWFKYRFLGLGFERSGSTTDWKMFHARKWYDQQIADGWAAERDDIVLSEPGDPRGN